MSGIVEFMYTLLLGWMRAVVDWVWLMFSGSGSSGVWQWFLSNWKLWLVILLIGGLVVDWLMWVVRWRPYRLLFGRFRRAPEESPPAAELSQWDDGAGYYEQEPEETFEPAEWTDMTLRTLSEIDPNWAGDVVMEDSSTYYSEAYEVPVQEPAPQPVAQGNAYWEETPDELDDSSYEDGEWQAEPRQPVSYVEYEPQPQQPADQTMHYGRPGLWPGAFPFSQEQSPDEPSAYQDGGAGESAYADYGDPSDAAYSGEAYDPRQQHAGGQGYDAQYQPYDDAEYYEQAEDPRYSRGYEASGYEQQPASQEAVGKRRRRKADPRQPWDNAIELPTVRHRDEPSGADHRRPLDDTRPSRVVRPVSAVQPPEDSKEKKRGLRTVTGKPAKRRGLMHFGASEDEPIAGLLPLELEDAFLPPALPNDPDFAPDDGNEY